MKSSVILVVLLSAGWLVVDASCLFGSKKTNAVHELNERLTKLTSAEDLASNVKAAREHDWQADFEDICDPQFKKAVEAFKQLDSEDICTLESLENSVSLGLLAFEKKLNAEMEASLKSSRVVRLLKEMKLKVNEQCFSKYEQLWSQQINKLEYATAYMGLMNMGYLMRNWGKTSGPFNEAEAMSGAVALFRDPQARKFKLKREEMITALANQAAPMDRERFDWLVDRNVVMVCKRLVKAPEVDPFFRPILQAALLMEMDDLDVQLKSADEEKVRDSVYWTARYVFCLDSINSGRNDKLVGQGGYHPKSRYRLDD